MNQTRQNQPIINWALIAAMVTVPLLAVAAIVALLFNGKSVAAIMLVADYVVVLLWLFIGALYLTLTYVQVLKKPKLPDANWVIIVWCALIGACVLAAELAPQLLKLRRVSGTTSAG